jgi:hypothetical protein
LVTKIVSIVLCPEIEDYGGKRENINKSGRAVHAIWYPLRVDG